MITSREERAFLLPCLPNLSSQTPAACKSVVSNHIQNLEDKLKRDLLLEKEKAVHEDINKLKHLVDLLSQVKIDDFSKFKQLTRMLQLGRASIGWTPQDPEERLVIFTECEKS